MIPEYDDIKDGRFLFNVDLVATILSLLGSILMCFLCYRVPAPKSASIKFIFAIAISDLFYSIANLMSVFETKSTIGFACIYEAIIRQSSFTFSIFFSACTAIVSYKASLPNNNLRSSKIFNGSVIGFPIVYVIVTVLGPFYLNDYVIYNFGPINCSIQSLDPEDLLMTFLIDEFYRGIPILLGLIISVVGYIKIIKKFKTLPKINDEDTEFKVTSLIWYPLGLILIFLPTSIEPILKLFLSEFPTWMMTIRLGVPHSIGFINAIMYITLRKLYHKVNDLDQTMSVFERDSLSYDDFSRSNYSSEYVH